MLRRLVLAWAAWRVLRRLLPILVAAAVLLMLAHATVPPAWHRPPDFAHRRQHAVDPALRAHHPRRVPR